jgi:von Willebrand factor A domain-containing protein 5
MEGIKIQNAKSALMVFIKSLPPESRFNIVSFGSEYEFMFPESVVYSS